MTGGLVREIAVRIECFFFPPLCIICDKPRPTGDKWFCNECKKHIITNAHNRNACPRCGQNRSFRECTCDIAWDHPFDSVFSFVDYDETIRTVMHQIKYAGKGKLATYLGGLLTEMLPSGFFDETGAVIPVPLHRSRQRRRGYNQAERFAGGVLSKIENAPPLFNRVLFRNKATKTQTKLNREERQKNLHRAFSVLPAGVESIKGKAVVLVDDVVTTGATTAECAEALLRAGSGPVKVLSLTRD